MWIREHWREDQFKHEDGKGKAKWVIRYVWIEFLMPVLFFGILLLMLLSGFADNLLP